MFMMLDCSLKHGYVNDHIADIMKSDCCDERSTLG